MSQDSMWEQASSLNISLIIPIKAGKQCYKTTRQDVMAENSSLAQSVLLITAVRDLTLPFFSLSLQLFSIALNRLRKDRFLAQSVFADRSPC